MRRLIMSFGLVLAACGSVADRPSCRTSADCAAGTFCDASGADRRCWPDAASPVVSAVTVTCSTTPCLRDATLQVEATATDDQELAGAVATVSPGGAATPLARTPAGKWAASLPLAGVPLEALSGAFTVTVVATDGARNESAPRASAPVDVTRVKQPVTLAGALSPTAPAVMSGGTVVVGDLSKQIFLVRPNGAVSTLAVGTGLISAAPAIGERAIWVGSEDGKLYGVKLDGTALLPNVLVDTLGAVSGAVGVRSFTNVEWGFGSSASGRFGAASSASLDFDRTGAEGAPFTTGPVIDRAGRILAATSSASATRRCYPFDGLTFGNDCGTAPVGSSVSASLAIDAADAVWSGSQDGKIFKAGTLDPVVTLADAVSGGLVILANGDVVVGDQAGKLHRLTPAGNEVWATLPDLGAPVLAPLALAGGSVALLVPTKAGKVFALRGDGTVVWEAQLAQAELKTGNIYTAAGAGTSTAWFPANDGKLYALVVDGHLDTAAPWPKAFHDARNTSNAGTAP